MLRSDFSLKSVLIELQTSTGLAINSSNRRATVGYYTNTPNTNCSTRLPQAG